MREQFRIYPYKHHSVSPEKTSEVSKRTTQEEPTVSVDQEMPTDMEDLCEEFKEHPDFYWVEIQIRLHLQVEPSLLRVAKVT